MMHYIFYFIRLSHPEVTFLLIIISAQLHIQRHAIDIVTFCINCSTKTPTTLWIHSPAHSKWNYVVKSIPSAQPTVVVSSYYQSWASSVRGWKGCGKLRVIGGHNDVHNHVSVLNASPKWRLPVSYPPPPLLSDQDYMACPAYSSGPVLLKFISLRVTLTVPAG